MINGVEYPIYQDPKTDREKGGESFKKSHKGCIIVKNVDGSLVANDGLKYSETQVPDNMMKVVFKNGKLVKNQSLSEIRERLNGEF